MYASFEPKVSYMGLPPFRTDHIEKWLRHLVEEPRNTHFLLWTGRNVIAHAALIYYPNKRGSQEIIIFVHQEHQGRGWGRKMFLATLNWACLELQLDEVWLYVDWHNVRARQLYASVGFEVRSAGIKSSELLMRRKLNCTPCLRESCPVFATPLDIMHRQDRSRRHVPKHTPNKAVFLYTPQLETYHYPADCPFKTERATKARQVLASTSTLTPAGARERGFARAQRRDLERFHTPAYLDTLQSAETGQHNLESLKMGIGSQDCPIFPGMYEYARLACGGTLAAARLIIEGKARVAFNPSGGFHHAGPAMASGFCYLNDIVLGCMEVANAGMKVLVLDMDVHHGEGVQEAFYSRNDVLYISLHETGTTLFPGTGFEKEIGTGAGSGYTVNLPLPPGTFDETYLRAFAEIAEPLMYAYAPDVVVVELGMDALSGDPLAHLSLTNNAYAEIIGRIMEFGKPVLATGGGGYHVENTARGWALMWQILTDSEHLNHAALGVGGVLLESTEWHGGLRDRRRAPTREQRYAVDSAITQTIDSIKNLVFPLHDL
jgi:acetoin utilization protein AcuC